MFTSYDIKIDLPEVPSIDKFSPLERDYLPEGHPFKKTSFWKKVLIHDTPRLKVNYFITPAGEEVPWHKDGVVWSTFNYLIEGDSPFVYKTGQVFDYKCGLFDVSKDHMVPASDKDRFLLKFSLVRRTYEEMKGLLDTSLKGRDHISYEELVEILK